MKYDSYEDEHDIDLLYKELALIHGFNDLLLQQVQDLKEQLDKLQEEWDTHKIKNRNMR